MQININYIEIQDRVGMMVKDDMSKMMDKHIQDDKIKYHRLLHINKDNYSFIYDSVK
jgi:uncharacterized protein (UPF0248 family)